MIQTRTDVHIKKLDYTTEYENGDPVGMDLHIIGRDENNERVHIINNEVASYFCVPEDEVDQELSGNKRVTGIDWGYESIFGDELAKIKTRIPGDVPALRNDKTHFEADILYPNRFLIDSQIGKSISIPTKYANNEPEEVPLEEIESTDFYTDTRVLYCDIEVMDDEGFPEADDAEKDVVTIAFYDNFTDEHYCYVYHPDHEELHHKYATVEVFTTEQEMLDKFAEYLTDTEPDVITGWNFDEFDARYLINRMDNLSSCSRNDLSPLGSAFDDKGWKGKIKGIAVFDLLRGYQNLQFEELDSFGLEDVAQQELGTGKVKDTRKIHEQWNEVPEKLVEYNVKDVKLTVDLDKKLDIIRFYETVADIVDGRLSEMVDFSKAADKKILQEVGDRFVLPSKATVEGNEEFEGGAVFDPISGVRPNIGVLDLASLYPMSMKTINAGPRTKDPDGDITAPNGISFTTEKKSIVVDIIDELLEERDEYKKLRDGHDPNVDDYDKYDMMQNAVKIIMNCFSGDTDVVTPDGIRNIKNIEVGDSVYSINPDTGEVEVKPVIDTVRQENMFGELKHIDNQYTNLKITPNHRMVTGDTDDISIEHYHDLSSWETHKTPVHRPYHGEIYNRYFLDDDLDDYRVWVDPKAHGRTFKSNLEDELCNALEYKQHRAAYLLDDVDIYLKYKNELYQKADVKIQKDNNHASIPPHFNTDDLFTLIGWYISEGSATKYESDDELEEGSYSGQSHRIDIAQDKDGHRADIVSLIDDMGINYTEYDKGVSISNSLIYEWMVDNCGAKSNEKHLPEFIFDMNIDSSQLDNILVAAMKGDGQRTGESNYRYSTNSKQLCEDMVRLAVLCGYKAQHKSDGDIYRVLVNKNKGSYQKRRVNTEGHTGDVYCITVKDNHTVLAGRKGKYQWTGNTLYGLMGWDRFRMYDDEVAASVTAVGRECIRYTKRVVNELGYEVVYGDTDSVMLELGQEVHLPGLVEQGLQLEETINEAYDEFAMGELGVEEHFFEIEFEKLYRRYFQAGKKKRYAGHIIWKDGKQISDIDIVGFEYRRSDYSEKARDLQLEVLTMLVKGVGLKGVSSYVREEIARIKAGEYDMDTVGMPSSVTKAFDKYESKTMSVKGSEYANEHLGAQIRPGDKPKGMYLKKIINDRGDGEHYPMPDHTTPYICWKNQNILPDSFIWDWEEFVSVQVEKPLGRIFKGTDWSLGEVISGQEQTGLSSYAEDEDSDDDAAFSGAEELTSSYEEDQFHTDHEPVEEQVEETKEYSRQEVEDDEPEIMELGEGSGDMFAGGEELLEQNDDEQEEEEEREYNSSTSDLKDEDKNKQASLGDW